MKALSARHVSSLKEHAKAHLSKPQIYNNDYLHKLTIKDTQ